MYTADKKPWFQLSKKQWINQQVQSYVGHHSKSVKCQLIRQLDQLNSQPDLITSLLSSSEQIPNSPIIIGNILDLILLTDLSPSSYSSTIYRYATTKNGLQSMFTELIDTLCDRDISNSLLAHKETLCKLKTLLKQSVNEHNTVSLYKDLVHFYNDWLPTLSEAHVPILEHALDRLITYQVSPKTSKKALSIIKNRPETNWDSSIYDLVIEDTFNDSKDYTLDELIDKIYPNRTPTDAKSKEALEESYSSIISTYESQSSIGTLSDLPIIKNWDESHLSQWVSSVKISSQVPLYEYIAVINRAVELYHGYSPRMTQLLSVYLLLHRPSNSSRLLQINTGEGKSLILAMAASYYGLKGKKVDIITTSVELSRPEVIKQHGFYALFGLSVAENSKLEHTQQSPEQRKQLYKSDIIYGTASDFQGDILQTEFLGEDILTERTFDICLVDEVDSMLYDSRKHSVRLSSLSPAMQHMELPLAFMWQQANYFYSHFVEREGTIYLEIDGESREIEDINTFLTEELTEQLSESLRELTPEEEVEWEAWNEIHAKGILIGQEIAKASDDYTRRMREEESQQLQKLLHLTSWEVNNRKPILHLPPHLLPFARKQIPNWIKSMITSLNSYKKEYNYTIKEGRIAPIDCSSTGVVQSNTVLSNGLTQFLEIREGLRISPEGITTNFISNIAFFKRYGNGLCGLTGTLGTTDTQSFLNSIYGSDMLTIPPHKHRIIHNHPDSTYLCKELPTRITHSTAEWKSAICETVLDKARHGSAVLIICEYIQTVHELRDQLASQYDATKLYTYDGHSLFEKNGMDSGEILIATNIAGRGTDLVTSESVEDNGGLHVCVTFLPESYRVELQNVGRTARQGKKGSAQLVLYHPTANQVNILREERNTAEQETSIQAKADVIKMLAQDYLFSLFCSFMEELFPKSSIEQKQKALEEATKGWESYANEHLNTDTLALKFNEYVYQQTNIQIANYLRKYPPEQHDEIIKDTTFRTRIEEKIRSVKKEVVVQIYDGISI
ncbi:hypothetical protein [Cardinium endosymbiont of Culicoides punctatus]|uniref:hypothetical protein n=1 Tax=Cardinium endosymbiont of Culicoides punctatus TaxID=2304601 RepID=UPI001058BB82|nr:hypothetical protein [Cardinium endosymbiont of Culicoides punctatus]TDG95474.1 Protein translocase subunit SecA [Cardinium endosymbiont of Culicoides punctatus]